MDNRKNEENSIVVDDLNKISIDMKSDDSDDEAIKITGPIKMVAEIKSIN